MPNVLQKLVLEDADADTVADAPVATSGGRVLLDAIGKNIKVWSPYPLTLKAEIDLLHSIENLPKDAAFVRLSHLQEVSEKTSFEIGGVLSRIRKNKWFHPSPTFDVWVRKNTSFAPSTARAWIQVYEAFIDAAVPWAKIKHIPFTKLRAIAPLLPENADHWIETAAKNSKRAVETLVKQHLKKVRTANPANPSSATVKTVGLRQKLLSLEPAELISVVIAVLADLDEEIAAQVRQGINGIESPACRRGPRSPSAALR